MIRTTQRDSGVSIELTPMIDTVFLLLTFFLVATTFQQAEREMRIALPEAAAAQPITAGLREIVVNVDSSGALIVNGVILSGGELRSMIETAVASNPEQKVTIRGDRQVPYEHVVTALDICKGAGVAEPFLDTVLQR
ncbi:MAG: biopolymer transporter ExbD [Phycisphaeraceae bacterium]|nr:biopolymer transporter ExbD [Phycisphaeraceae bacterium]